MARSRTGKAQSAAERMRRYRARRRAGARAAVLNRSGLIRTLARAHGARSIELFGSAARGEERPASDLDFIADLEPGRSLLDLIGLADDLESALGRKVDAVTPAGLKPRVLAQARREAIRIV